MAPDRLIEKLSPPPLPGGWPFTLRPPGPGLEDRGLRRLPGLEGEWRLHSTADIPESGAAEPLGGMYGRGGLLRVGGCIVRPYRRGGLLRRFNKETYPSAGRFLAEYFMHSALWRAGFPTVEPVGYAYRRGFWGAAGVYITVAAEGRPWPDVWQARGPEQAEGVARLIGALSSWGLWAPDMNATNILVAPDGGVLALDWDRAGWADPRGLGLKYLGRLRRSMLKLSAPAGTIGALERELGVGS